MSEDLKEKLKTEVEQADWDMLKQHHEKQAVFIVSKDLDILDVGVALAQDDKESVQLWLDKEQLAKPNTNQVENFEKSPYEKFCRFIIIQPFVLIQVLD